MYTSSSVNFLMTFLKTLSDALLKMNQSSSRFVIIWRQNQWQKALLGFTISAKQDQLYCRPSSESHPDCWRTDLGNKGCVHHCYSSSSPSSTTSALPNSGGKKDSEGKRSSEASLKLVVHLSQSPSRELFAPPTVHQLMETVLKHSTCMMSWVKWCGSGGSSMQLLRSQPRNEEAKLSIRCGSPFSRA